MITEAGLKRLGTYCGVLRALLAEPSIKMELSEQSASDLRALLDAYEEQGREIERLRAENASLKKLANGNASGVNAEHERAEQAEARLARMVEALKRLRAEAHGLIALERDALIALVSLTNVRCVERAIELADAALAAAQPEEKP